MGYFMVPIRPRYFCKYYLDQEWERINDLDSWGWDRIRGLFFWGDFNNESFKLLFIHQWFELGFSKGIESR